MPIIRLSAIDDGWTQFDVGGPSVSSVTGADVPSKHVIALTGDPVHPRWGRSLASKRLTLLTRGTTKSVLLAIMALINLSPSLMCSAETEWMFNAALVKDAAHPDQAPANNHEDKEHGLPQSAVEITRLGGFPITNSMVVTWVVALGLIVFAHFATRDMKLVPTGAQNFIEWLVGGLEGFLERIMGRHLAERTFWFFGTIFIFILATNWVSLIPGVGTVGWGHRTSHGFRIDQPLLRGGNADVNMTFAMALVFFACWIVWAMREVGPIGFLKELFAPKGETTGLLRILMIAVFFAAGCLEIVSILFRPVSLGFRLYGNVFAGENMLEAMANLVPGLGWLVPIPFYFLELLMGLVQALVFMLLTAVFTMLICQHEAEKPKAA